MKFSKKILEKFIKLPANWVDLFEDLGLEIKSRDGDNFTLELLANRGDHYCYNGIAREIAARLGIQHNAPDILPLSEVKNTGIFAIKTEKCLAFSLTKFDISHAKKFDASEMLSASGVNTISPAVDITNVVMLELGQPTHIYDADKIKGQIVIRESVRGEKAELLFHEGETALPTGTMVIADEEKILCIAGVIGCRAAEVDENTTNILFEAACFDPVSVRKTARALGVCTISSQIFERGADIANVRIAPQRANKLYYSIGVKISGDINIITREMPGKPIEMKGDYVRAALGLKITDEKIAEILARYGFSQHGNTYSAPSWRVWDIKNSPADLVEELARGIGYNKIPSVLPPVVLGAAPTAVDARKTAIENYLISNGFYEVLIDNMYSPKHADLSPDSKHIKIINSIEGGYAFMRNNAIVQAAELVYENLCVKNAAIRAFEWGKIFPTAGEKNVLWGIMTDADPLELKGILNGLAATLDISIEFPQNSVGVAPKVAGWFDSSVQKLLSPKRNSKITANGSPIGIFGELHPTLLAAWDIKGAQPVYFEFGTDALLALSPRQVQYTPPSKTQSSVRDLTLAVPYGTTAADTTARILKTPEITAAKITDVFDKPTESVRNITFALTFTDGLSTDEINKILVSIK
ncbi:MAG: phenylalanine--tRNA ligase subunit beta [Rickettsiales bacterium]|jgi:phenylalanyl-tRNA synthetase beta chain|nr:phenylalanine--tRNA ligase subunit beta [Rickettsiales bacterium]